MITYQTSICKPRTTIKITSFFINYSTKEFLFLIKRLFIQTFRRPSSIISGIIQPLLWLILFGGLFQNLPIHLFNTGNKYSTFLSCGIIIFTSFTGSLNAGLPLIFDREFGFLNRLLVAPMISRSTIILAAITFIICLTMTQNIAIILCSLTFFQLSLSFLQLSLILLITFLITSSISNLSLSLAFALPGHIEFLACILIINLPMLFASTALAPLYFMPHWLQIIAKLNPLTYAIESIRFISLNTKHYFITNIINVFNIDLNLTQIIIFFTVVTLISFTTTNKIIVHKIE